MAMNRTRNKSCMHRILLTAAGVASALMLTLVSLQQASAQDPSAAELGIMHGFVPAKGKFVDSSNWNSYPLNRWVFQNVRRFMPTAALNRDPAMVVPFVENRRTLVSNWRKI